MTSVERQPFYKYVFDIKYPSKVDMPLNKDETKKYGPMSRVFANSLGDRRLVPGPVIPKT